MMRERSQRKPLAFIAVPTEQPPRKLSGKRTVSSGRSGERWHESARKHLFEIVTREGIDFDLERRGILHIYRDKNDFESGLRVNALLSSTGCAAIFRRSRHLALFPGPGYGR
jgi:hypothetical protein